MRLSLSGIAACVLLSALSSSADDKPRVLLSVSKRTVGQPTGKTAGGEEKGRMQTLAVTVENQSIHALPEGSLRWNAVVRKVSGGSYKYSGTEVLKPIRSFQSAEILCGSFEIDSRQGLTGIERDRIDYELVLLHSEKESARVVSASNFAALAEKAEAVTREADEAVPKAAKLPEEPAVKKPAGEKAAATDGLTAEQMAPRKPGAGAAELPPVPQQKFDFFNLGGKKAPYAR